MHLWGFFSGRLSHLHAAALLCVVSSALLAGCDRPSANNTNNAAKPNNPKDRVVAYVSDVSHRLIVYGPQSFLDYEGVDISPDGSHYAVMHKTQYGARLDIDGVEGLTGAEIFMPVWSHDGKSYGYRIGNQMVINGQAFGPYKQALDPAFSPVSKSWAFLHTRKVNGTPTVHLVRDGQETALTTNPTRVNFDPAGAVIFQFDGSAEWKDFRAQPAQPPVPMKIRQFKTGVKNKSLPKEKGREWCRIQLVHNGRLLGTFDDIPNSGGRIDMGYPQPDGRVLIYAIDNEQLLRFYVTQRGEIQNQ